MMEALVFDPTQPRGVRLGEAPEPTPMPFQALIEVLEPSTIDFQQQRLADGRRAAGRRIERANDSTRALDGAATGSK